MIRFFLLTLLISGSLGCASVQPWQRGDLARNEMSFDPDPQAGAFQALVYESKEAASGGAGTGGGGCGCN